MTEYNWPLHFVDTKSMESRGYGKKTLSNNKKINVKYAYKIFVKFLATSIICCFPNIILLYSIYSNIPSFPSNIDVIKPTFSCLIVKTVER
jgi:hypothetical protein